MGLLGRKHLNLRSAKLEDAGTLSKIQNDHIKKLAIIDRPKSAENIRLAIGSSMLGNNNYFVMEENNQIIGFIEQNQQNNSHVMLSYPYVDLDLSNRNQLQKDLIEQTLKRLKKFGYRYASTRLSSKMNYEKEVYNELGFASETTIFQIYHGQINPDYSLVDSHPYEFRRVKAKDLEITYSWIKRQLSPISPLYISKEAYSKMLHAPKLYREGWSMATIDGIPVASISSFVDVHSDNIVVFGPFNDENEIEARIPLFNELNLYYAMIGKDRFRLMRINLFDNDKELINKYNLHLAEDITVITKKL